MSEYTRHQKMQKPLYVPISFDFASMAIRLISVSMIASIAVQSTVVAAIVTAAILLAATVTVVVTPIAQSARHSHC